MFAALSSQFTARGGEVFPAKHHRGMLGEYGADVGLVILAVERQQEADLLELPQLPLELLVADARISLAQAQAMNAVFADDSAPERVVAVQYNAFGRPAKVQAANVRPNRPQSPGNRPA